MLVQLDGMVVTILRDAVAGERGFDKYCRDRQVHILMPDSSTRVIAITALVIDGIKPTPLPAVPPKPAGVAAKPPAPETDAVGDA